MAQEIGVAYVTLLPSAKGFSKKVEGEIGQGFDGGAKKQRGFWSKAGKFAKGLGIAIGGAVALVGGIAAKGGLDRALKIEDATAKLKGLGHDTKTIETIMNSALKSVKGTAFGLDTAATVAASAVASGIKPGKELEKYLRLTADAATIAGVSMEEMGSIINKVTAKGVAQMDDMNRLTERGIPILQWLADEYGVTADAMSKMVSSGQVDAETFRKVIEENIGGAALESGETTRGAFANMLAALSRVGQNFLSGVFPYFKDGINGITDLLGPLEDKAGDVGKAFGDFIGKVKDFFSGLNDARIPDLLPLKSIVEGMAPHAEKLGDAFSEIGKILGGKLKDIIPVVADAMGDIGLAIGNVVADDVLPALVGFFEKLGGILGKIDLAPFAEAMGDDGIAGAIEKAGPLLGRLIDGLGVMLDVIEPVLGPLGDLIEAVLSLVEPLNDLLDAWSPLLDLFGESEEPFTILSLQMWALSNAFSFVAFIIGVVADVMSWWFGIMGDVVQGIVDFVTGAVEWFTTMKDRAVEVFTNIYEFLSEIWSNIGLMIGGALKIIVGLFTGNIDLIKDGLSQFSSSAKAIWDKVVSAFSTGVTNAVNFVKGLPGKITAALSDAGTWLVETGKNIIQGLIDGASGMIDSAVQAVKDVGGAMMDGIKDFLGIHSPSRAFRDQVGKWIPAGLVEGIEDGIPEVEATVNRMVSVPELNMSGSAVSGGPVIGSVTFQGTQNMRSDVEELMFHLRRAKRGGVHA